MNIVLKMRENEMVKKWFRTIEGKKALAAGYVIALVVIAIEAIRYVISLIVDLIFYGENIETAIESYSYAIGLCVGIIILAILIHYCDWD